MLISEAEKTHSPSFIAIFIHFLFIVVFVFKGKTDLIVFVAQTSSEHERLLPDFLSFTWDHFPAPPLQFHWRGPALRFQLCLIY